MTTPAPRPSSGRLLDTEALKGLAHPIRVAIFEALSTYGPATATMLGERLDESSGATSYHLRQLAKHGLVREVEGRGTGRERWWERMPGGIRVSELEFEEHSAGREASRRVADEWERNRAEQLRAYHRGWERLPREWAESSTLSTANVQVTAEEFAELSARLEESWSSIVDEYRGRRNPGSRPVQLHLNAFPVIDGDVTPGGAR